MSKFNIDGHKMLYHLDRVHQWQQGDACRVFPIYIEVSPVGYCNHRCSFCAVDYLEYKQVRLDTQILKNNLMSMGNSGVRSVMFAGEGEPLLHPNIAELIVYASKSLMDVAVTTNGVPMSKSFSDRALEALTWIKISCNAGDAETYAKIHGCKESDWTRVWKNIDYAVRLRDRLGLKTTIGVQAVLLPDNAKSMNALAHQCKVTGVDYLVVKPYSQHTSSITHEYEDIMYEESYDKYLNALSMYASSKFEIITRHDTMKDWDDKTRGYDTCLSVPYFWAYVMANGDVYTCSAYLGDDRFNIGNINKNTFHRIWIERPLTVVKTDECRQNCRMHHINKFLWNITHTREHKNFI